MRLLLRKMRALCANDADSWWAVISLASDDMCGILVVEYVLLVIIVWAITLLWAIIVACYVA